MRPAFDPFAKDRLPPAETWPEFIYETPELAALRQREQLNITVELLERWVEQGHGQRIALRDAREQVSYAELRSRVWRMARWLQQELKLIPGQRLLLRGGNGITMAVAWLATVRIGVIAVATMPLLRARELASIIDKGQIRHALCAQPLLAELQLAQQQAQVLQHIHTLEEAGQAAQQFADAPPEWETSAEDLALMAFTSGTTGAPKAVLHSHRDVLAACECWPRHVLRQRPEDIVTGTPPLAFTFGLGGLLLFALWAGASVYYPDAPYTPESLLATVQREGVSVLYSAPTFYRRMAALTQNLGMPSLRICVSAGEGLPDATRQLWRQATGIELLDGIGATEMFHIFISSPPEAVRRGAIGKVVPGYQARVVDAEGNTLPPGQPGRLAVIGPTGCRYLDDPRQTLYVRSGWNYPGDTFMQDEDGYFYYLARDDDMIITSGYNVAGPEVENCLALHPAVAEVGVTGKPDAERGMIVKAFVVLREGHEPDVTMVKTLQDFVKSELAPYKYPREIEFVPALPRTETGKLQRHRLRAWAQHGRETEQAT